MKFRVTLTQTKIIMVTKLLVSFYNHEITSFGSSPMRYKGSDSVIKLSILTPSLQYS